MRRRSLLRLRCGVLGRINLAGTTSDAVGPVEFDRSSTFFAKEGNRKIDKCNSAATAALAGRICACETNSDAHFLGKTADHEESKVCRWGIREVDRVFETVIHLRKGLGI